MIEIQDSKQNKPNKNTKCTKTMKAYSPFSAAQQHPWHSLRNKILVHGCRLKLRVASIFVATSECPIRTWVLSSSKNRGV